MNPAKLLGYAAIWAFVGATLAQFLPSAPRILEPRTALFVIALPWLVSFAGFGPGDVLRAARDPFARDPSELPLERRRCSAGMLRKLGGLTLTTGTIAFFASTLTTFQVMASTGGQANPMEVVVAAPAALLAPLTGFILNAFVYEPLAASLEAADSGLGADLLE